ncbi:MAG: cytochrome C, partial [Alphaproteobacteria bacterium]|nr:cytochrome C [Alphaproteobacteria bacterium]
MRLTQTLSALLVAVAMFAVTTCICASAQAAEVNRIIKVDRNFDHDLTGFELKGAHGSVACETCHFGAVFKGVPTVCEKCHDGGLAKGKPEDHPPTSNSCGNCHTVTKWSVAHVDHGEIKASCFSCHNGVGAEGKGTTHIPSRDECADCHETTSWTIAHFRHDGV